MKSLIASSLSIFVCVSLTVYGQQFQKKIHQKKINHLNDFESIDTVKNRNGEVWIILHGGDKDAIINPIENSDSVWINTFDELVEIPNSQVKYILNVFHGIHFYRNKNKFGAFSASNNKILLQPELDSIGIKMIHDNPYPQLWKNGKYAIYGNWDRKVSDTYLSDSIIFADSIYRQFCNNNYEGLDSWFYKINGKWGAYYFSIKNVDEGVVSNQLIPPLYDTIAIVANGVYLVGENQKFGTYTYRTNSLDIANKNTPSYDDFKINFFQGDTTFLQEFTGLVYDKMECISSLDNFNNPFCVVKKGSNYDLLLLTYLDSLGAPIFLSSKNYSAFAKAHEEDSLSGLFGVGNGYPYQEWYILDQGGQNPPQRKMTSLIEMDVDSIFWNYSDTLRSSYQAYVNMGMANEYVPKLNCELLENVEHLYIAKDNKFRKYPLFEAPVLTSDYTFPILFKGYPYKVLDKDGHPMEMNDVYDIFFKPSEDIFVESVLEDTLLKYFSGTSSVEHIWKKGQLDYYIFDSPILTRMVVISDDYNKTPNYLSADFNIKVDSIEFKDGVFKVWKDEYYAHLTANYFKQQVFKNQLGEIIPVKLFFIYQDNSKCCSFSKRDVEYTIKPFFNNDPNYGEELIQFTDKKTGELREEKLFDLIGEIHDPKEQRKTLKKYLKKNAK